MGDYYRLLDGLEFIKHPMEFVSVPLSAVQGAAARFRRDVRGDIDPGGEVFAVGTNQHHTQCPLTGETINGCAELANHFVGQRVVFGGPIEHQLQNSFTFVHLNKLFHWTFSSGFYRGCALLMRACANLMGLGRWRLRSPIVG
ncbi:hypothetical protein D3C84_735590 [compost metagenome]